MRYRNGRLLGPLVDEGPGCQEKTRSANDGKIEKRSPCPEAAPVQLFSLARCSCGRPMTKGLNGARSRGFFTGALIVGAPTSLALSLGSP
jgi:hypothetical protein